MVGSIDVRRKCSLLEDFPARKKVIDELVAEEAFDDLGAIGSMVVFAGPCVLAGETRVEGDEDGVGYSVDTILEEFGFDCKIFLPVHVIYCQL